MERNIRAKTFEKIQTRCCIGDDNFKQNLNIILLLTVNLNRVFWDNFFEIEDSGVILPLVKSNICGFHSDLFSVYLLNYHTVRSNFLLQDIHIV